MASRLVHRRVPALRQCCNNWWVSFPFLDARTRGSAVIIPDPYVHGVSLSLRRMTSEGGGDRELLRILKSEIEHEKQASLVSKGDIKRPPEPFTIDDKPGAQEVFLYRSFNSEDIKVSCLYQTRPYSEDNEDADEGMDTPSKLVQMVVKVSKKGDNPYLEIQCITTGEEPVIEHVSYKGDAKDVKDLAYEGPQFQNLDPDVQRGFQKYLQDRGINTEFSSFILTYMCNKEQQEYCRWLQNVQQFVMK